MKYEVNVPQPKPVQRKFKEIHLERAQLNKLSKPVLVNIILDLDRTIKGMTKGFQMGFFNEKVKWEVNSIKGRKENNYQGFEIRAKNFGKRLKANEIPINDKLTAGKALKLLGDKEKEKVAKYPDSKTARKYIKYLLAAASKVPKIKKVL